MSDSPVIATNVESRDSISSKESRFWRDATPQSEGLKLLQLSAGQPRPFVFELQDLSSEIKENMQAEVIDIQYVGAGANRFGLSFSLRDGRDVLVRISRFDINWTPLYAPTRHDAASRFEETITDVEFEAAVYNLLRSESEIKISRLIFYRAPARVTNKIPDHLAGRDLFVFQKAEGQNNAWPDDEAKSLKVLTQCAHIRAALFLFKVPLDFVKLWLPRRPPNPKVDPIIIAPTRHFAAQFLTKKVEEVIKNEGDMIGWGSDHTVVGPIAARAKESLLRIIPLVLPRDGDQNSLYRLVLDHDDFGLHNMSIADESVTSVFDWDTAHIVPAILSDPQLVLWGELTVDEDGAPIVTGEVLRDEEALFLQGYAKHYHQATPNYIPAIKAGKDARHIWFALKFWRGADPENFFGDLGTWADRRWEELTKGGGEILT
ncbi:hypothetical protein C8R47DRAFT_974143 [Mycena vitilis]|nr:hypothetical protein C8R47DRAFT_974143 [Mycena vitilis]